MKSPFSGLRVLPRPVRHMVQRYVSLSPLKLALWERNNPLRHVIKSDEDPNGYGTRFGIVRDSTHYYQYFVRSCLELRVPFTVLDLTRHDWLDHVTCSKCDVLLVWPDGFLSIWSTMIKDRLWILERDLGYPAVPGSDELWMHEDKRRLAYWLSAHGIPHPRTWVFYSKDEAHDFARQCELPIIFKTSFGAGGSGVQLLRTRSHLRRLIKRAFSRGVVAGGVDRRDVQWASVILQEYLPDVDEWRLVRIGDSYFGHRKVRHGFRHSGSGEVAWDVPDRRHLEFLRRVTEEGAFRSMAVDVFETPSGSLLVNELQASFGASVSIDQMRSGGQPGRFTYDIEGDKWTFEAGPFAQHACAMGRVQDALARQLKRKDCERQ